MKKICLFLMTAVLFLVNSVETSAVKREQRATWMSAYTQCWPTSSITESTANTHKRICINNLDSLQKNNMTTIYYHVRTMCDAMYDSKYEPWSSYVSGTRGQAPIFDPFAYLIENAHARGIEVYAWLNPYRYLNSIYADNYGSEGGDKNYENSHPDWLIEWKNGDRMWTILNPALPEVKQRIVDVVADIMSKYDIDGIVFDDYFYQTGLPLSYDAAYYEKYKSAGGTLSQGDWRRENVNDMVRKVNAYIKSTKPWVRFGIGPAGVACGTNLKAVADKYGIEPCPGSDWQYNGIYSDPIAWYNEGSIDFMSPQVYWVINGTNDYRAVSTWWYKVAAKFNRHCFISQDLSNSASGVAAFSEFLNEIDVTRTADETGAPGTVYFPWKSLKARTQKVNRKNQFLLNYLRYNAFQYKALTPAATWINVECPGQVSSVKRNGRSLTWNGPSNVKYTIYAVPKDIAFANFHKEEEYLRAITYTPSWEVPAYDSKYANFGISDADLDKYNYAVCVLDRYGNEYSAVFEGATVVPSEKPVIMYPTKGAKAPAVFDFKWTGKASTFEIAIATDAEMKNVLVKKEVSGNYVKSSDVYGFEAEKTYYCTITARDNNATETRSDVVSFTVDVLRITSPLNEATGCEDNLTITWSTATPGAVLRIASDSSMETVVYEAKTDKDSHKIPEFTLCGNLTYYAQVVAGEMATKVVSFTVKNMVPSVPVFTNPTVNGQTIYSNHRICLEPERGIYLTRIEVCATQSFGTRSSYIFNGKDFTFMTPHLSEVRVGPSTSSPLLTDGKTYYVRAKYTYYNEAGKSADTEYSPVMSFVYNKDAGIQSLEVADVIISNDVLQTEEADASVNVFTLDGKLAMTTVTDSNGDASLEEMDSGSYIVTVVVGGKKHSLKYIK